jgi:hypothetical protein
MKRIYIASPYGPNGDTAVNVRRSLEAANALAEAGLAPFAPLLSHFWHFLFPHPSAFWMAMDMEWVRACDALLRLSGASDGADQEVALAHTIGIPVFYSVEKVVKAAIRRSIGF